MFCQVSNVFPWCFATDAMGSNDFDAGGWGMTVTQISRQEEKEIFQHGEAPGLTVARLGEVWRL